MNYDGHLDALVTCLDPTDNKLTLYSAISTSKSGQPTLNITEVARNFDDQVLLLDWNGDYFVDVLGSQGGATVVLLNNGNATFAKAQTATELPRLSVPNSNAFLDLDGDCHADLVLTEAPQNGETRVHMAIWLYKNGTYQRHASHPLPPGAGQLSFADFDRDGAIDLAFPVCWPLDTCSETQAIVLVRNVQRPLCGGVLASGSCRSMTAMCESDPAFYLADFGALNTTEGVTVVGSDVFQSSKVRFYTGDAAEAAAAGTPPTRPLAFNVGDYNLDGYPDLLVPMVSTDPDSDHAPHIQLWENMRCNRSTCSALGGDAEHTTQRVFVRQTAGMGELGQARGAYAAAFMDFGESGAPGVVVLTEAAAQAGSSSKSKKQVHALFNNFRLDALFIKAQGLNGICTAWCPTAPQFPSPKPYGVNYPGGAFKFALTDTDGTNLGAAGAQLYRTAYHSLQTPYVMFGLGRISNYIQTVFYGTAAADHRPQNYWQGIIPNSYIFAIPYPHDKPPSWTIELFLAPSSVVFFVILVVLLSLIALGVLIIIFKSRELVCFHHTDHHFSLAHLIRLFPITFVCAVCLLGSHRKRTRSCAKRRATCSTSTRCDHDPNRSLGAAPVEELICRRCWSAPAQT